MSRWEKVCRFLVIAGIGFLFTVSLQLGCDRPKKCREPKANPPLAGAPYRCAKGGS